MPDAHEFTVPIHDLDAAGKSFRFPLRAAWIRGALEGQEATAAGDDGDFEVRVSKSGNDVVVHGKLKAALELPCARCLAPVKVAIEGPISALMVPAGAVKGSKSERDEYEFSADEADVVPYSGDTIILDDLVRDELLLEIPMIPLCSEDCPGISPPPGINDMKPGENARDAIDPRLAPLLKFKKKE